jgi:hypothetical protein
MLFGVWWLLCSSLHGLVALWFSGLSTESLILAQDERWRRV